MEQFIVLVVKLNIQFFFILWGADNIVKQKFK